MTFVQSASSLLTLTEESAGNAIQLYFEPLLGAWNRLRSLAPRSRESRIRRVNRLNSAMQRHLPELCLALSEPPVDRQVQKLLFAIRLELGSELLLRLMKRLEPGKAKELAQELMELPKDQLELEVQLQWSFSDQFDARATDQDPEQMLAKLRTFGATKNLPRSAKPTYSKMLISEWRIVAFELLSIPKWRLFPKLSESLQKSLHAAIFANMDLHWHDFGDWERKRMADVLTRLEKLPISVRIQMFHRGRTWSEFPESDLRDALAILSEWEQFQDLEHLSRAEWTRLVLEVIGHWAEPKLRMELLEQVHQAIKNKA